jgi:hypothetical protein
MGRRELDKKWEIHCRRQERVSKRQRKLGILDVVAHKLLKNNKIATKS